MHFNDTMMLQQMTPYFDADFWWKQREESKGWLGVMDFSIKVEDSQMGLSCFAGRGVHCNANRYERYERIKAQGIDKI